MGLFSRSTPSAAEVADDLRATAKLDAKAAAVAKALGAEKAGNQARRRAAEQNVVARYSESGRCQFGHKNCTDGGH